MAPNSGNKYPAIPFPPFTANKNQWKVAEATKKENKYNYNKNIVKNNYNKTNNNYEQMYKFTHMYK